MSGFYYDAGAEEWLSDDGSGREVDGRAEDDAFDSDAEKEAAHARDAEAAEPEDDPAFREARRGQRELSGRVRNHGRRRGNHPTGFEGRGIRGLRVSDSDDPRRAVIRPTGRQLGAAAPATGRQSLNPVDTIQTIAALLGRRRLGLLQESLARRGKPSEEARAARVYLAVLLRHLDDPAANLTAAWMLAPFDLGDDEARRKALRRIGDLRRGRPPYAPEALEQAENQLRAQLGRL
jgi:hypothetical protein